MLFAVRARRNVLPEMAASQCKGLTREFTCYEEAGTPQEARF
jgi:hypothetical protein